MSKPTKPKSGSACCGAKMAVISGGGTSYCECTKCRQPCEPFAAAVTIKPQTCPGCGRTATAEGQPSRRWFFACGSYMYDGDTTLRDRTDLCHAVEALNAAAQLLNEIRRDEVNAQDQAEKWLRAYAPQFLVAARTVTLALLCILLTGCVVDSQKYTHRPDGSYTMRVSTWCVGMNARAAGMKSDWQTMDCIYGDSISNLNAVVETRLVEAISEGVAAGMVKGIK